MLRLTLTMFDIQSCRMQGQQDCLDEYPVTLLRMKYGYGRTPTSNINIMMQILFSFKRKHIVLLY